MTKNKTVNGLLFDGKRFTELPITVRFTSDEIGKMLSLSDNKTIQITVAFEDIETMAKECAKNDNR